MVLGGSEYLARGSEIDTVRTLFGSKPGSTACSLIRLLIIRPDPTSSINESAICATTNQLSTRCPRPLVEPRLPSFNDSLVFGRDDSSAGSNPKMKLVKADKTSAKPSTRLSIITACNERRSRGLIASRAAIPQRASNNPKVQPVRASNRLSVNN